MTLIKDDGLVHYGTPSLRVSFGSTPEGFAANIIDRNGNKEVEATRRRDSNFCYVSLLGGKMRDFYDSNKKYAAVASVRKCLEAMVTDIRKSIPEEKEIYFEASTSFGRAIVKHAVDSYKKGKGRDQNYAGSYPPVPYIKLH
jgi:hypothetical protein